MTVDSTFSLSQFLSFVLIFVGVPTLIGAGIIRTSLRSEKAGRPSAKNDRGSVRAWTGSGNLGLWSTGLLAFVLGVVSCVAWLSWSADYHGELRGPGLPAPNQFPAWQVLACGVTVVLACLVAAHLSRWAMSGGLTAAAGTAAGFTTAFSVDASADITGQSGVGVGLSEFGWALGLGVLMFARGAWLTRRQGRRFGTAQR